GIDLYQLAQTVPDNGAPVPTKLNGTRIESSEFGPLNPGDHLWLGGCVLVYDMDQSAQESSS
ncbi:MAG: hypothetical protein V3S14_03265, partial [Anaerolineae bacterium]